jgi:hypothetical protein
MITDIATLSSAPVIYAVFVCGQIQTALAAPPSSNTQAQFRGHTNKALDGATH